MIAPAEGRRLMDPPRRARLWLVERTPQAVRDLIVRTSDLRVFQDGMGAEREQMDLRILSESPARRQYVAQEDRRNQALEERPAESSSCADSATPRERKPSIS